MTIKQKLNNFKKVLGENDEMFLSLGSTKQDYQYIQSIIDRQGYWSGAFNKYYFDEDFNLTNVESRF